MTLQTRTAAAIAAAVRHRAILTPCMDSTRNLNLRDNGWGECRGQSRVGYIDPTP